MQRLITSKNDYWVLSTKWDVYIIPYLDSGDIAEKGAERMWESEGAQVLWDVVVF